MVWYQTLILCLYTPNFCLCKAGFGNQLSMVSRIMSQAKMGVTLLTRNSRVFSWTMCNNHDDVIKRKDFPRYWPFVRWIHRSLVDSPHKGQRRRALMCSFICAWTNGWANNQDAGDLRRHRAHYCVTVMILYLAITTHFLEYVLYIFIMCWSEFTNAP